MVAYINCFAMSYDSFKVFVYEKNIGGVASDAGLMHFYQVNRRPSMTVAFD